MRNHSFSTNDSFVCMSWCFLILWLNFFFFYVMQHSVVTSIYNRPLALCIWAHKPCLCEINLFFPFVLCVAVCSSIDNGDFISDQSSSTLFVKLFPYRIVQFKVLHTQLIESSGNNIRYRKIKIKEIMMKLVKYVFIWRHVHFLIYRKANNAACSVGWMNSCQENRLFTVHFIWMTGHEFFSGILFK